MDGSKFENTSITVYDHGKDVWFRLDQMRTIGGHHTSQERGMVPKADILTLADQIRENDNK